MEICVKIPALDRLCGILEGWGKAAPAAVQAVQEVTRKVTVSEGQKGPQEPPKAAVEQVPAPAPKQADSKPQAATEAPTKAQPTVTMDALQRAAAQMRDEGKLQAVTGLFPEFGIKKLSDLKGDKLTEFAARLRAMGATI